MILPSDDSLKTFNNLLTGYRSTMIIIKSVELGIIEAIGYNGSTVDIVISECKLKEDEGRRFLSLLNKFGIVELFNNSIYLTQFSRKFLYSKSDYNQLAAIDFEPYQVSNWNNLDTILKEGQGSLIKEKSHNDYQKSLQIYQSAMHNAAKVRSNELWDKIPIYKEDGLIIDFGSGDGTYLIEFLKRNSKWKAVGCDLADVNKLNNYSIHNLSFCDINLLDIDEITDLANRYNKQATIILLSNLIHCYSEVENLKILQFAEKMLDDNGVIIVHDFFTDANSFGAIYDIHMMVNTFNGKTYSTSDTENLFKRTSLKRLNTIELSSSSLAMLFSKNETIDIIEDQYFHIKKFAIKQGFFKTSFINTNDITVKPWVKAKCEFGCMYHSKKWSCPPHSMTQSEFKELLKSYSKAILVAGQPPLKSFQKSLIELEKSIFLAGNKKALAFTGGPCSWCEECDENQCRFPEKRRPSLESCGCDVFQLANDNGINIAPVKTDMDFVTYIGLVLIN